MNRREPVSIVCVFNDGEVLANCLTRSVTQLLGTAPETELIAVDNTSQTFASAGSALGFGAARARHKFVTFIHQDVVLHSLAALEEAAGMMADDPGIGIVGCSGIDAHGRMHGRMRDRTVLTGLTAPFPTPVDSLDEVQFMVRATDLRSEPLAEAPELAWHAYAVEYGLRLCAQGRIVAAVDIPLTHNSLTVNLDRLDVAHAAVGRLYPEALPIRTTCGLISDTDHAGQGFTQRAQEVVARTIKPHRWRYRWLRESVMAHRGRRRVRAAIPVLADIRLDIDDVLAQGLKMTVLNVDDGWFGCGSASDVTVMRRGHIVRLTAATFDDAQKMLHARSPDESVLLTNLTLDQLRYLHVNTANPAPLLGFHMETGYWLLLGPAAALRSKQWDLPRAVPALTAASK